MELSKKDAYLLWECKLLSLTFASLCHKCFTFFSPLFNYCIPLYVQSASMGASLKYTVQEKQTKGSHKAGEGLVMDMGHY